MALTRVALSKEAAGFFSAANMYFFFHSFFCLTRHLMHFFRIVAHFFHFFFFSSLAVNALWHGPNNDISGESGTQRNWPVPVKKGKSSHTPKTTQTKTTRKSPSQTCVSSQKQQSSKTKGARPNKKHPQLICRKIQ